MTLTRNRQRLGLLTLTLLSLIAGLAWAQGSDTPIIISDGSLTIESRGVPWSQFTGTGRTRNHPQASKTVTAVDLTVNGRKQTIPCGNQRCTVTAQYGRTTITVDTGNNGKGLKITTDFPSAFHGGATGNHMAHNDEHDKLGAITVKAGSQTRFTGTGTGGSIIMIHYQ